MRTDSPLPHDPAAALARIVARATAALDGPGLDVRFADIPAPLSGQHAAVYTRGGWAAMLTVEGTTAGRVLASIEVAEATAPGGPLTNGPDVAARSLEPRESLAEEMARLAETPLRFSALTLDADEAADTLALAAATVRAPVGFNEWYETGVIGDPIEWTVRRFVDDGPAGVLRAALDQNDDAPS